MNSLFQLVRVFILLGLIFVLQTTKAQSGFSLLPGIYYNGAFLSEYTTGVGVVVGLEYMPPKKQFLALELRGRYGIYSFDDKEEEESRLKYYLFTPQIAIVPKLYYHFDETISFFLENEFSVGLMHGSFEYGGTSPTKKRFRESIFNYCIVGGIELKGGKSSLSASIGYSSLNFKDKIKKRQPVGYQGGLPNQEAPILISMTWRVPLSFRIKNTKAPLKF